MAQRVFTILSRLGRQSLRGLQHCTQLSPNHLKHGLVVLIQQHLILHNTTEDDVTYYEVDWRNAYALVRSGKLIKIVEDRFGEKAGGIISNLLLLGHAKVGDFTDAYQLSSKKKHHVDTGAEHINGDGIGSGAGKGGGSKIQSLGQLHALLHQLLQAGYITIVRAWHFKPAADLNDDAERLVKREVFPDGVKGGKAQAEFRKAVQDRKRKWRDDDGEPQVNGASTGTKRASGSSNNPSKRVKVNGWMANGHAESEENTPMLDNELVVRINYEKCNVVHRSRQLVDLAAKHIGDTTSNVYQALLQRLEDKTPRCIDELADFVDEDDESAALPSTTTLEVSSLLDPAIDLTADIAMEEGVNGVDEGHDASENDEEWSEDVGVRKTNGAPLTNGTSMPHQRDRLPLVEKHIRLLADDPRRLIRWVGNRGRGEWKVDFPALTSTLIQREIQNTVSACFGSTAARIVHILHAKGKLDEKQVATFGLLRQKDIRATLTSMQEAGFVETQEVPKEAARQPRSTIYLWYFDQDRCRKLLLNDTYKSMSRLLQRIKVEKAKVQAVIDKAERTDVVNNEEKYLTNMERDVLREWRNTEEKLLVQLARQDDLVALFRDFTPEMPAS
ncbi:RNA polymerase III subunit C82 [Cryomyces antarcticus]|nr:RNA polymerase III subunit C82 [Cryomyces antarcticus]